MHPRAKVELIASAIYIMLPLALLPMQKALHHYDVMSVLVTYMELEPKPA